MTAIRFTVLERRVLEALYDSSSGNGHDFGFTEDARNSVSSPKQLSGVIASLIKKKIISVYEGVRGEDAVYHQFTFRVEDQEKIKTLDDIIRIFNIQ